MAEQDPPVYEIPPDLVRHDDFVLGQSRETWHLPRDVWRPIREKVTGKGTVCAVLDTGIVDHPALPTPLEARSFIRGESVTDRNGHATHCAGTVLSRDEDIGVAPDAELVVGKVLSDRGSGSSSGIAAGIRWATELGVDVISMSLGGGSPYQPTIEAVIEAMDRGIWVVIAAGNSGFNGRRNTIGWPARSDEGCCTGAYASNGQISGFSSGGSQMTWAAPGSQILSCSIRGGFVMMSGTSMATPFAAGIACLVTELEKREGHAQMRGKSKIHQFIEQVAEDRGQPGHDPSWGHGVPKADQIIAKLIAGEIETL